MWPALRTGFGKGEGSEAGCNNGGYSLVSCEMVAYMVQS